MTNKVKKRKINVSIFITRGQCLCGHDEIEHRLYGDGRCWRIVSYSNAEKFEGGVRCECNRYRCGKRPLNNKVEGSR